MKLQLKIDANGIIEDAKFKFTIVAQLSFQFHW
jgi:hypothetical protein